RVLRTGCSSAASHVQPWNVSGFAAFRNCVSGLSVASAPDAGAAAEIGAADMQRDDDGVARVVHLMDLIRCGAADRPDRALPPAGLGQPVWAGVEDGLGLWTRRRRAPRVHRMTGVVTVWRKKWRRSPRPLRVFDSVVR